MNKHEVNEIIDTFGGVAGLCASVENAGWPLKPGSVYKWRNNGRIPELWGTRLIVAAERCEKMLNRDTLLRALDSVPVKQGHAA